jgi:hypothetical protein
VSY